METISSAGALDLLHLARTIIRSRTRSPNYFDHANRFSAALLSGPLGVARDYYEALGTDLTIIDAHYEALLSQGEAAAPHLRRATVRLQAMAEPSRAAAAVPSLRRALEGEACSLLEAARATVAAITLLGHATLTRRVSAAAAARWLTLWQDRLSQQDRQQEAQCGLCLLAGRSPEARARILAALDLPPGALRPAGATFAAGVAEYLDRFSETGAVGVLLAGGLPFAETLRAGDQEALIELLGATPAHLDRMSRLMRLAQDVRFDGDERINAGFFGMSAELGVDVVDLDGARVVSAEVEARLRREWVPYATASRRRADASLAALRPREALHRALTEITDAVSSLAERVVSASYKA
ncbi:MAG: hypothetical protein R3B09_05825 [Nannocystaceae bacterium]